MSGGTSCTGERLSLLSSIGNAFGAVATGLVGGARTVLGISDAEQAALVHSSRSATTWHRAGNDDVAAAASPIDIRTAIERARQQGPLPGGDERTPPPGAGTGARPGRPSPVTIAPVRVFDAAYVGSDSSAGYVGDGTTLAGAGPQDARVAAANVSRGLSYFASTFGRSGIDGAGRGVDVVINDRSTDASGRELFRGNGGYYTTRDAYGRASEAIRWGGGTSYHHRNGGIVEQYSMLYAEDLTIHELTHGIIKAETGALGGTADEAGSVNEGFADVLAAAATRDWRMGESMYSQRSDYRYMRNIASPDDPAAVHGLWTGIDQYRTAERSGSVEEHYASGIISTAAYRIQSRIGGEAGWQAVEQLYYRAVVEDRLGDMTFASTAAALRATAGELWGADSPRSMVVDEELRRAGL